MAGEHIQALVLQTFVSLGVGQSLGAELRGAFGCVASLGWPVAAGPGQRNRSELLRSAEERD